MLSDALGHTFEFDEPPRRVVSLVPSLTEILFELGAGETVVGVTDFCIFPPEAREKATTVGGTKNPRVDSIRELAPDLVYMNLEENLKRHGEAIAKFVKVFVSEPKKVADVEALILQLGQIHSREERAAEVVKRLSASLEELRAMARPFRFAVPIWKHPWMWCGGDTYVSHLVTEAGGENVFAAETRYPTESFDEMLTARKPDVIFLPDEPYLFTSDDARELEHDALRVIGPFPGHLFTWHGTRTIEGLNFLRDVLERM